MAIKNPCETVTFTAAADLSAKQYNFVYQSAANAVSAAADGQNGSEVNVYILQNKPESGEEAECAVLGTGQSLLELDAAAAIGADIMISTGSLGTARVGANKYSRATIEEAATAANDYVIVNTTKPVYVAT